MPTFHVTAPDQSVYEVNGPEGSTPEDAIKYVQDHLDSIPKLKGPTTPAPEAPKGEKLSFLDRLGTGAVDVEEGLSQLFAHGVLGIEGLFNPQEAERQRQGVDAGVKDRLDQITADERASGISGRGLNRDWARGIGQLIFNPANLIPVGGELSLLATAGRGALQGATATLTTPEAGDGNYALNKLKHTAQGAAIGSVAGPLARYATRAALSTPGAVGRLLSRTDPLASAEDVQLANRLANTGTDLGNVSVGATRTGGAYGAVNAVHNNLMAEADDSISQLQRFARMTNNDDGRVLLNAVRRQFANRTSPVDEGNIQALRDAFGDTDAGRNLLSLIGQRNRLAEFMTNEGRRGGLSQFTRSQDITESGAGKNFGSLLRSLPGTPLNRIARGVDVATNRLSPVKRFVDSANRAVERGAVPGSSTLSGLEARPVVGVQSALELPNITKSNLRSALRDFKAIQKSVNAQKAEEARVALRGQRLADFAEKQKTKTDEAIRLVQARAEARAASKAQRTAANQAEIDQIVKKIDAGEPLTGHENYPVITAYGRVNRRNALNWLSSVRKDEGPIKYSPQEKSFLSDKLGEIDQPVSRGGDTESRMKIRDEVLEYFQNTDPAKIDEVRNIFDPFVQWSSKKPPSK